jgi:hypothetical protein
VGCSVAVDIGDSFVPDATELDLTLAPSPPCNTRDVAPACSWSVAVVVGRRSRSDPDEEQPCAGNAAGDGRDRNRVDASI